MAATMNTQKMQRISRMLAVALAAAAMPASAARPMNVLFVTIDDLRPEVGCYGAGGLITPNIDRLAKKGLKFSRAYCQYPVCNPSRASFMTGKRPDELEIVSNKVPLRQRWPDLVTLPQLFRNNGYYTAGLGKLFHQGLDENGKSTLFRDDVSFEHQFKALGNSPKIGREGEGRKLGDGSIVWAHWLAAEGGDKAQPDGMLADEAVRVLAEVHDKPFFLGVGFHKPHDPFIAPKEYFEHYPLDKVELAKDPADRTPLLRYSLSNAKFFSSFKERDQREFKRAYHACTTFADAQVGKVFAAMDRFKLWDNTIVVLLGDHGYHLGEHGWWNKVTVFELGARAPLMMWVPGAGMEGAETDAIVEFLDLYPTLADLCGLEVPHKLSGRSLRPLLESPSEPWKHVAYTQVARGEKMMGYSVRTDRWRFIQWGKKGEAGVELYDHTKDAIEYYNLAERPEHAGLRKEMVELLERGFPVLRNR
jgi:iduronate 2-sulfatase